MLTQSRKILLFGLPVVGKTTICQWLVKGLTDIREADFHATIDHNKYTQSINDTEIVFYDFGGATAFLDRFTGELAEIFFTGATGLIFLIDSIKPISTPQAKYYLDLCVKNIERYSPKASVFIFQHKIDLIPQKLRGELYQTTKDYLIKDISKEIHYYETSLVNSSIMVAMSAVYQAILGFIPNVIPESLTQ